MGTTDVVPCGDAVILEWLVPAPAPEVAPGASPDPTPHLRTLDTRAKHMCTLHIFTVAAMPGAPIEATFHGRVYGASGAEDDAQWLEGRFRVVRDPDLP
jgi:hypothetical protein